MLVHQLQVHVLKESNNGIGKSKITDYPKVVQYLTLEFNVSFSGDKLSNSTLLRFALNYFAFSEHMPTKLEGSESDVLNISLN